MLDGLKVGNEALKKANEMFSIGEIEQIMDDTSEAVEKQNEISAILSGMMISRLFGILYIYFVWFHEIFANFFFLHWVWFHEIFIFPIFPFLGQLSQEDEEDVLKELDDLIGSEENISELPEVPTNGK